MKADAVVLLRQANRGVPWQDHVDLVPPRGHMLRDGRHEAADPVAGETRIRRRDHDNDVLHVRRLAV